MNERPLIVLAGPTASGKSDAAVSLCQAFNGEIITADSMQVYRKMDIGTAKPTQEERQGIPHHMVDVVDPDQSYNVFTYRQQALKAMEEVYSKGKTPVLAGGTGLYIDAVLRGYDFPPSGEDPEYRLVLEQLAREHGPEALYQQLCHTDPAKAATIHPHNIKRVIRALEILHQPAQLTNQPETPSWSPLCFLGLTAQSQVLAVRINRRVEKMMARGLLEEVSSLNRQYPHWSATAKQALGYKELLSHLAGECTLEEAVACIQLRTRQYAKRQMTWFRREPDIRWVQVDENEPSSQIVRKLTNILIESFTALV